MLTAQGMDDAFVRTDPHGGLSRQNQQLGRVALIATFGGLLFGYDTGVINGALVFLAQDFGLSALMEGIITSFLLLGAATGAIGGGRIADVIGRRRTILMLAALFFAGALCCAIAPDARALAAFRFLLGLAVGGASVVVPTYLAELAPAQERGALVTRNELMTVGGQLLAFAVNAVIGTVWGHVDGIWRWMLGVALLPAIILGLGMLRMPESPRWLIMKGRCPEARGIVERLNADVADFEELTIHVGEDRTSPWELLRTGWMRRVLLIGIGIAIAQQVTGVNSIMYYGTQILSKAGLGDQGAIVANVLNGVVSVLATFFGIWLLGRIGRRTMLLVGLAGTTSALLAIGSASFFFETSVTLAIVVLAGMILFLTFQQGLISPVTWVLLAEIFPLRLRGFAMGATVFVLWITNFVITLIFPSAIDALGVSGTFLAFVVLGLGAIAFTLFAVPETRDLSLEEIEAHFEYTHRRLAA